MAVIEALVASGADPNCRNSNSANITPLTLVVLRGASCTLVGASLIGPDDEALCGVGLSGTGLNSVGGGRDATGFDASDVSELDAAFGAGRNAADSTMRQSRMSSITQATGATADVERSRVAGRRVWIKAAEILVQSGMWCDTICTMFFIFIDPNSLIILETCVA